MKNIDATQFRVDKLMKLSDFPTFVKVEVSEKRKKRFYRKLVKN